MLFELSCSQENAEKQEAKQAMLAPSTLVCNSINNNINNDNSSIKYIIISYMLYATLTNYK